MFEKEEKELLEQLSVANKFEYELKDSEEVKQGSKEWFKMRLGLFTGSKLPALMTRGKGSEWGETSMKVIKQVYIERDLSETGIELYVDELFSKEFRQTQWGNKYEPYAREEYSNVTGFVVEETSFTIHKERPNIGGSFDGKIVGHNIITEIKCPYDILIHASNYELECVDEKHTYYAQIQCNIEIAKAESCDFVSFDPRRKSDKIKIINVPRDEDFIARMLRRIDIAEKAIYYMNTFQLSVSDSLILSEKDYDTVYKESGK